jgi:Ca2+-binding EF-hand superfamily protein
MKSLKLLALAGLVAFASTASAADGDAAKRPKLDTDGDGALSKEEVAAAPEKLQARLKEFDKDGDGALSKEEYEAMKAASKKKTDK